MFIVYWPEIAMVTRVVLSSGGAHLLQIAWLQGNTAPYKMEVKLVNDETFSRLDGRRVSYNTLRGNKESSKFWQAVFVFPINSYLTPGVASN